MSGFSASIFTPPSTLMADEWAEQNVILKDTGRFKYDHTPFFREPTHYASDLISTCRIVVKCCAQLGKTTLLINVLGWMSQNDAANSLLILDTAKTGQRLSKDRIRPFLRDTCHISAYDLTQKDRSKSAAHLSIGQGASLIVGSSKSASDLCSMPVKYLFADELDRWTDELKGEGDPLLLAFKRQLAFMGMAMLTSTPTRPDGRIQQHYLLGTQETWSAVCPCGCYMRVSYDDIDWAGSTPTYACPQCGEVRSEQDIIALPHAYTPPQNPTPFVDDFGRVARSYEVTATLCHRQYTWSALKKEEMQARSLGEASIRSFRNTTLGETYVPPTQEILSVTGLTHYCENFDEQSVPNFVEFVTIGVDVQDRAFPWILIGASADLKQIALISWGMIKGDLRTNAPWDELKQLLSATTITRMDGVKKPVHIATIDSGGHFVNDVLLLSMLSPRIRAVKGRDYNLKETETTFVDKVTRVPVKQAGSGLGHTTLTRVNTRFAKETIYAHLYGKLHDRDCGKDWHWTLGFTSDVFEQLTSEVQTFTASGNYIFEKLPNRENHFLDCLVYALAGAEILRLATGASGALGTIEDAAPVEEAPTVEAAPAAITAETPKPPKVKKLLPVRSELKPL